MNGSGAPPYRSGMGYQPPGAPSVGPQGTGGAGAFSVVGGRAYDPKPPPELIAMIRAWASGKAWRRTGQESVKLPWVSIELLDIESDRCVHPVDDVSGWKPDDLSHDLWERAKGNVRMMRDTRPRSFALRCRFADAEGRESFEECPITVVLPPEDQQWGQHASSHYQAVRGGGYGAGAMSRYSSPAPHITGQEIDVMAMGLNLIRDLAGQMQEDKREDRRMIQAYQSREIETMRIFQGLMEDKAEQERKQLWETGKLKALELIAGRLSKIAPPVLMQIGQAASGYLGGGRKRTEREELAFDTLRGVIKRAKAKGADTPQKLLSVLEMMGIGEDDEIRDDIITLLTEMEVDEQRKKLERAASLSSEVLIPKEPANGGEDEDEGGPLGGEEETGT